jgi:hypothetical protein
VRKFGIRNRQDHDSGGLISGPHLRNLCKNHRFLRVKLKSRTGSGHFGQTRCKDNLIFASVEVYTIFSKFINVPKMCRQLHTFSFVQTGNVPHKPFVQYRDCTTTLCTVLLVSSGRMGHNVKTAIARTPTSSNMKNIWRDRTPSSSESVFSKLVSTYCPVAKK